MAPIAEAISTALFEIDPMRTACRENDAFDEYDRIAQAIVAVLEEGMPVAEALRVVFIRSFDESWVAKSDLQPAIRRVRAAWELRESAK